MEPTLVYDAARDSGFNFDIGTIGTIAIVGGLILMSVPLWQTLLRQPAKRARAIAGLVLFAVIGAGAVFALPKLGGLPSDPETIEGYVGQVSPSLISVGGIKVMVKCGNTATCPGVKRGDYARVAYVEDMGPETSALGKKIWTMPAPPGAR